MPPVATPARAGNSHDLIIAGGGVHGMVLALLAAEAGQRVALLDRGQPGQATSAAWFGILHGGLRYLQSMDIRRLRASLRARRWFMRRFPDQVTPLPFLMPLYDRGLKRAEVFRLAFLADAVLTADRNRGLAAGSRLPRGRVLGTEAVTGLFADVPTAGLRGGALWQEVITPDPARLFAALVEQARAAGVEIHTGTEVTGPITEAGRITGVTTMEHATGQQGTYHAPMVVNTAGPWNGALARRLDPGAPALFHPALGFNLLLDRPPPAPVGLSLSPPEADGAMLFVYPRGRQSFAGTWYAPWTQDAGDPGQITPTPGQVAEFLAALNASAPGLEARAEHVVEITAGLLPAHAPGSTELIHDDLVHDHARHGGPTGLFSLTGIKYTTAPEVARHLLARMG